MNQDGTVEKETTDADEDEEQFSSEGTIPNRDELNSWITNNIDSASITSTNGATTKYQMTDSEGRIWTFTVDNTKSGELTDKIDNCYMKFENRKTVIDKEGNTTIYTYEENSANNKPLTILNYDQSGKFINAEAREYNDNGQLVSTKVYQLDQNDNLALVKENIATESANTEYEAKSEATELTRTELLSLGADDLQGDSFVNYLIHSK